MIIIIIIIVIAAAAVIIIFIIKIHVIFFKNFHNFPRFAFRYHERMIDVNYLLAAIRKRSIIKNCRNSGNFFKSFFKGVD